MSIDEKMRELKTISDKIEKYQNARKHMNPQYMNHLLIKRHKVFLWWKFAWTTELLEVPKDLAKIISDYCDRKIIELEQEWEKIK